MQQHVRRHQAFRCRIGFNAHWKIMITTGYTVPLPLPSWVSLYLKSITEGR